MQLHYQSIGNGTPLIFIHGLFGSGDNWRSIAKHFADDYQVITLDLRNHGRSPQSDDQTYALMAEDLLALMDDCNIEKAHIVGHSMGGKVAMQFATQSPDRVNKLVVVDMATRAYADEHSHLIDAMLAIDLQQHQSRQSVDGALKTNIPVTMVRQFLLMNLVRSDTGLDWRINLPSLKDNYPALQSAVCEGAPYDKPCLFIHGEMSEYVLPADKAMIQQRFSQAAFIALPTGHWIHAEAPTQFIEALENYLSRH